MGRAAGRKVVKMVPKWARDQDAFLKGKRYPACRGTFPDCPPEIKDDPADVCTKCPFFGSG